LPSLKTVGEYLDVWLDASARHRVRASTLESYTDKVRLYVRPILGSVLLQKLRPGQLQALYGELLAGSQKRSPISPRSASRDGDGAGQDRRATVCSRGNQ